MAYFQIYFLKREIIVNELFNIALKETKDNMGIIAFRKMNI